MCSVLALCQIAASRKFHPGKQAKSLLFFHRACFRRTSSWAAHLCNPERTPYPSPRTIKSDNRYYSEGRTSQPVWRPRFSGADLQACRGSESERPSYFPLFELAGDIFMGIGLTRHNAVFRPRRLMVPTGLIRMEIGD